MAHSAGSGRREPALGRPGPGTAATSSAPAPATSPGRLALVDVLRGVGIALVVLGHVVAGLNTAGLLEAAPELRALTTAAYSVHMPLFAFLSGLFVASSVRRRGALSALGRRARMLAYLFVLWTLLQGGAEIAASGMRNGATTPLDLLRVWEPIAHLWFLPWLLAATAIAMLARPWRRDPLAWIAIAAAAVLAVLTWGTEGAAVWNRGLPLLVFFLVGAMLTARGLADGLERLPRWAAGVAGALALLGWAWIAFGTDMTPATAHPVEREPMLLALGMAAAVLGILAALLLTRALLPGSSRGGLLAAMGRDSMAIYLAHLIVAAGTRVALLKLGIDSPWIVLVAALLLGIAVPMLLARIPVAGRILFDWPLPERPASAPRHAAVRGAEPDPRERRR